MKNLFVVYLFILGFAGAQAALGDPINVVVSMQPQYDLVRQIAGDVASVTRVLPIGASPHTFEPTPSDVAALVDADLVVTSGVIDDWLLTVVEASGTEASVVTLIDTLTFEPIVEEEHDHEGEAEAHDQEHRLEHVNPHIWNDPLLMAGAVPVLVKALSRAAPAQAETFAESGEALRQSLIALDTDLAELLTPVQDAPFVPFHDAWPYFVRRYGLNQVAIIEPAPGREPSPSYIAEVLGQLQATGAKAIFNDAQLPARPAEVIAQEAGVALYTLDPEGGGVNGEQSYQDLMRQNARTILEALE